MGSLAIPALSHDGHESKIPLTRAYMRVNTAVGYNYVQQL